MAARQYCILVTDDNKDIRDLVSQLLSAEGYRTLTANDGEEMLEQLALDQVDLILLDVMLPGRDGFELCRQLQADPMMPPVIMLTAKDEEIDRVVGLELGAEDYVVKPFGRRELLARIKVVLRRARPEPMISERAVAYAFKQWRFSPSRMELQDHKGEVTRLSSSETELLLAFVENPQVPISRNDLLELTKGRHRTPFDRSIDSHISRLRRKLLDDARNPQIIKTSWGSGYLLACSVETL